MKQERKNISSASYFNDHLIHFILSAVMIYELGRKIRDIRKTQYPKQDKYSFIYILNIYTWILYSTLHLHAGIPFSL